MSLVVYCLIMNENSATLGLLNPDQLSQLAEWVKSLKEPPTVRQADSWLTEQLKVDLRLIEVSRLVETAIYQILAADVSPELRRPGHGLPLSYLPRSEQRFPVLFKPDGERGWQAATLTRREVCMLKLMEDITNKPEWWTKIRNPEIAAKWKAEAVELDWASYSQYADFTPAMADACFEELVLKAEIYEKTDLIPVMDYSETVMKSDKLVPSSLWADLKRCAAILENVPDEEKDWHPGSNGQVLDLIHPSLWPLVYGRSRILVSTTLGLKDSMGKCGMGNVIRKPIPAEVGRIGLEDSRPVSALSPRFQWLPCDVLIDEQGNVEIASYVNNLHPVEHAGIYPVLERFIQLSLPAWDVIYRWPTECRFQRLTTLRVDVDCLTPEICEECGDQCLPVNRMLPHFKQAREKEREDNGGDYVDDEWPPYDLSELTEADEDANEEWFVSTHPLKLPEPQVRAAGGNDDTAAYPFSEEKIQTKGFFNNASKVQVIVKMANIYLEPGSDGYPGGSWHIEGQLNEHIVSTALFYYDSDNITESKLAFRTAADAEGLCTSFDYEQGDHLTISRTFGIEVAGSTLQQIGSVLTRPERALFFPNVYQHRVQPFQLADASRPGHRKILALFLVDPAVPIISTANVPPQQRHWWSPDAAIRESGRFPPEVTEMILDSIDFPIGLEEAKQIREELMAERTVLKEGADDELRRVEWSFCEH
ncbi:hypothetical protein NLG97_g1461 [Lecanicillium saksenae]|uniref:Uncharacterized protein n=1 Tax=Lecanicillium saksenae TaxID=468837 RepID=A0ACC1R5E9_9HYPO|nr:hypothetical protein NLG97_g1461 [Lecanicillium saksenae]